MECEKMLQIKVVVFKKLYNFYIKHFLIEIIVFLIKELYVEMYTENRIHTIDRALSKLITLLISNKIEFNHFFKTRLFDFD